MKGLFYKPLIFISSLFILGFFSISTTFAGISPDINFSEKYSSFHGINLGEISYTDLNNKYYQIDLKNTEHISIDMGFFYFCDTQIGFTCPSRLDIIGSGGILYLIPHGGSGYLDNSFAQSTTSTYLFGIGNNGGEGEITVTTKDISPDIPSSATQYVKIPEAPTLEKQAIPTGTKVGKYQSGSGIILSAHLQSASGSQAKLEFEIFQLGSTTPHILLSTPYFTSGTGEVIVPYLGVGEYYWKVRTKTSSGITSEWVDYGTNYNWEYDFALFEGFEPYPYGYRFENSGPASGVLTGGIGKVFYIFNRYKIEGNKWDIFEDAFDLSDFPENSAKYFDAFESVGLNETNALAGGNCYGLSMSSLLQYKYPGFVQTQYPSLSSQIGTGTIWHNIQKPSTNTNGLWTDYNDILKSIYTMQVSQDSKHQIIERSDTATKNGNEILSKLTLNPNKNYILTFRWKKNGKESGHAVIPYKVEGNKIYFRDNNFQAPLRNFNNINYFGYNQYIEIFSDGTWNLPSYENKGENIWLTLENIDNIYNAGQKSAPKGFNQTDTAYILDGSADMYVEDDLGRKTGFLQGNILEEIPGVHVVLSSNFGTGDNSWKQIYLPQKQNLSVKIIGTSQESYNLMIAGGDYYSKLENIPTTLGQIDTYNSQRGNIKIDFDNSKNGSYNLLTDNFYNNGTGTIFMKDIPILGSKISYDINWSKVLSNSNDAVIYGVDINNDGTNDSEQELPPLYQYSIATLMSQPTTLEDDKNSPEEK